MRKLILYIAESLDGYIAKSNGDIEWLSIVEREGEDYGYAEFLKTIDTIIVGRKTYDKVQSMGLMYPPENKQCYVVTRQKRPASDVIFYNGDLVELVCRLKAEPGKNIFCDGGAETANALIKNDLIDEFIISVIPVLLGHGIRLFGDFRRKLDLKLLSSTSYKSGLVQNHYRRRHI